MSIYFDSIISTINTIIGKNELLIYMTSDLFNRKTEK